MPGAGITALVLVTIVLLLASGAWTERRYRRFDRLPAHYDFRGRPTRYASRRVMAWLLPATFSVMLVVVILATMAVPPDVRNGDTLTGAFISSLAFLGAQGLVLWLLARWARAQG